MTRTGELVLIYLAVMTLLGFGSMYLDKRKAKLHQWRISEKVLFLIAILGGSVGSNVGMRVCHHKTRHWYFVLGMPAILLVQAGFLCLIQYKYQLFLGAS
ncbi:MAG: DUF1294 domain-containing protein [Lachnospiraceae bacterium]|nr:DUF1294 domain-containing protein [Lachnospiraceae bacterium]